MNYKEPELFYDSDGSAVGCTITNYKPPRPAEFRKGNKTLRGYTHFQDANKSDTIVNFSVAFNIETAVDQQTFLKFRNNYNEKFRMIDEFGSEYRGYIQNTYDITSPIEGDIYYIALELLCPHDVSGYIDPEIPPTGDNITLLNGGGWIECVSDGRLIWHKNRLIYLALTPDGKLDFYFDGNSKTIADGNLTTEVADNNTAPTGNNITLFNKGGWYERTADGRSILHQSRSVYLDLSPNGSLTFYGNGKESKLIDVNNAVDNSLENNTAPEGSNITLLNGEGWFEKCEDGRTILHQSKNIYLCITADNHLDFYNGESKRLI